MIIHIWFVLKDRNITWESLRRKGNIGLGIWRMCFNENENNTYLFYNCFFAREVLLIICRNLKVKIPHYTTTKECIKWWYGKGKLYKSIPILLHWYMWVGRNRWIFRIWYACPIWLIHRSWEDIIALPIIWSPLTTSPSGTNLFRSNILQGFFDGTTQQSRCGCGAWLMILPQCLYKIY